MFVKKTCFLKFPYQPCPFIISSFFIKALYLPFSTIYPFPLHLPADIIISPWVMVNISLGNSLLLVGSCFELKTLRRSPRDISSESSLSRDMQWDFRELEGLKDRGLGERLSWLENKLTCIISRPFYLKVFTVDKCPGVSGIRLNVTKIHCTWRSNMITGWITELIQ